MSLQMFVVDHAFILCLPEFLPSGHAICLSDAVALFGA